VTTIRGFATAIANHFEDISIVSAPFIHPHPSLSRLLSATAPQGKSDNVPPSLAGDVIRGVLLDRPYPASLLQAAVRRARVAAHERYDPLPYLAAVIKASLNRASRTGRPSPTWKELTVALDPENPNPAYRLGRLFALLERAQEIASGGDLNVTIRERFYGAASTSPVTVFARLLTLKNHHVAKFEGHGQRVWMEGLIGDVMNGIEAFPTRLTLQEQGLFAVGYYHQRQSLFAKRVASHDLGTSPEAGGIDQ
jgi:CRISPR-associated protein Csd1